MRVELPGYTLAWLRGDKYGEVVKIANRFTLGNKTKTVELAFVRLDNSDEVVRVVFEHCKVLS